MIKVNAMGVTAKEVNFSSGMNVSDAVKGINGIKPDKSIVMVNGEEATMKTVLKDGDSVTISPRVRNG